MGHRPSEVFGNNRVCNRIQFHLVQLPLNVLLLDALTPKADNLVSPYAEVAEWQTR